MSFRTLLAAALGVVFGGLSVAHGALIINDSFDTYANQAAFEAVWTPIGTVAPTSAVLSSTQSVSSPNSVQVPAESTTNGKNRNRQSFSETSTLSSSGNLGIGDQLIWSFDFYDSNAAASPYRQYSNLQDSTAPSGTNQLISMGMNNNQSSANSGGNYYMARILGYDATTGVDPDGGSNESVAGAGAYFKLNDFAVGLRSTGWHNLKAVLSTDDGLSTDYAFYVDGQLAERVNNVGAVASIRSYDNITIGSGITNAGNEAFFDNVRLEYIAVPEPASLLLTGIAAIGAFGLRRRAA
jgi:hypothetical protein